MTAADFEAQLAFLGETPKRVAALVQGLERNRLRVRVPEDGFSAVEQVCHLRDIEEEGYLTRVTRMLAEEDPLLADIDGGKLAVERDYQSQNMAMALLAFDAARHETLRLLKNASLSQRERTGHFAKSQAITLAGLAHMMREHDSEHLAELELLRSQLSRE